MLRNLTKACFVGSMQYSIILESMKILIVTGIFPPDIGGPATYTEKLAFELIRHGHQVGVICYADKKNGRAYPFLVARIYRGYILPVRYFIFFWKVLKMSHSFDLLFAQSAFISGLPCLLVRLITGKKYITKIVGDFSWEYVRGKNLTKNNIDEFQQRSLYPPLIWLIRMVQKLTCKKSETIIVPSFYLKNIVSQWHVSLDKIKVVYNAVECSNFKDQKLIRQIVSVGRLVPWKGFDVLIGLMPQLLEKFADTKLLIVGDGPMRKILETKIKTLNLSNNVQIIGRVDREKNLEYLGVADIFVLNTEYEGFSHVILEAMMAGAVVVATDAGGNKEIIKDGLNGRLIPVNNTEKLKEVLLEVLGNNNSLIRERAQKDAANYNWNNYIPLLMEAFKKFPGRGNNFMN